MGFTLLLSLLLIISLHSISIAGVGLTTTVFTDDDRKRSLSSHIWYPTNAQRDTIFADNGVFNGFNASKDASILKEKFPLYILVHGTSGNWRNLSWLATKLAHGGAIVVSANHPNYTSGNSTPLSVIKLWDQVIDIQFLIGSMLESNFKKQIDRNKIIVIGYSLGGYSAMAVAGARLNMKKYLAFCSNHVDKACQYFKPTFKYFNADFFQQSAQSHYDSRIKASIAIVPGFVESMTTKSLRDINIPLLILGAEFDKNLPPKTHFIPRFKSFSAEISYYEISAASHFSFMQLCKPKAIKILAEENAEFVCLDGANRSREAIHNELYQKINNFIQKNKLSFSNKL